MSKRISVIIVLFFTFIHAYSQKNKTELYIEKYKDLAIDEMNNYGIPASITLSQGILESGNGESRLALEANNHFGIKCHNEWNGEKIYADDDEKGECFRKYSTVFNSYRDHSIFLSERKRYTSLFDLSPKAYKKWAKGLKKAGYATNPDYAKKLIKLIKKYNLNQYDVAGTRITYDIGLIFGFPFGFGIGGYWFTDMSLYSLNLQSSIIVNQFKASYNYNIIDNLYVGTGFGYAYFGKVALGNTPCCKGVSYPFFIFTPQIIYKWDRNEKSDISLTIGVVPLRKKDIIFSNKSLLPRTKNYTQWLPFIDLTYLIN
ncbi:MAG: glucosaminidase domain-containing protein [Bacteroidota bacterium]|nr:glucosaminidase domain-containing protein [Bacteroidota bacterium]